MAAASAAAAADPWARKLHYVVAVDGSEPSRNSFDAAAALWTKGDKLTVLHIADDKKEYLPFDQRPASVREFFESRLLALPKDAGRVQITNKPAGASTRDAILSAVTKIADADFLVVRDARRRGRRPRPGVAAA